MTSHLRRDLTGFTMLKIRNLWVLLLVIGAFAKPQDVTDENHSASDDSSEELEYSRKFNPSDLININRAGDARCGAEGDMFYARFVSRCYICACFPSQYGGLTSKCASCSLCSGEIWNTDAASHPAAIESINLITGQPPSPIPLPISEWPIPQLEPIPNWNPITEPLPEQERLPEPEPYPVPEPYPIIPEPLPIIIPEPQPFIPEPLPYKPEPLPFIPEPLPVIPEPLPFIPEPLPVIPESLPFVPEPLPFIPEPLPLPEPQPEPEIDCPPPIVIPGPPRPYPVPVPVPGKNIFIPVPIPVPSPPQKIYIRGSPIPVNIEKNVPYPVQVDRPYPVPSPPQMVQVPVRTPELIPGPEVRMPENRYITIRGRDRLIEVPVPVSVPVQDDRLPVQVIHFLSPVCRLQKPLVPFRIQGEACKIHVCKVRYNYVFIETQPDTSCNLYGGGDYWSNAQKSAIANAIANIGGGGWRSNAQANAEANANGGIGELYGGNSWSNTQAEAIANANANSNSGGLIGGNDGGYGGLIIGSDTLANVQESANANANANGGFEGLTGENFWSNAQADAIANAQTNGGGLMNSNSLANAQADAPVNSYGGGSSNTLTSALANGDFTGWPKGLWSNGGLSNNQAYAHAPAFAKNFARHESNDDYDSAELTRSGDDTSDESNQSDILADSSSPSSSEENNARSLVYVQSQANALAQPNGLGILPYNGYPQNVGGYDVPEMYNVPAVSPGSYVGMEGYGSLGSSIQAQAQAQALAQALTHGYGYGRSGNSDDDSEAVGADEQDEDVNEELTQETRKKREFYLSKMYKNLHNRA